MNKPGKQRTSWGGEHTLRVQESLLSRAGTLGPTLLASLALWQKWYPLSRPFYHLCKATSPTSLKHTHDVSAFRSHQHIFKRICCYYSEFMIISCSLTTQTARYPSMILWSAYSSKVWGKYLPSSSLTANICPIPYQPLSVGDLVSQSPTETEDIRNFLPFPSFHLQVYLYL